MRPEVPRRLAEGTFDDALVRNERAFNHDLGIRRDEQILAPGLGRDEPQGLSEVTTDDFILADFERAAVAGAHVKRRMMAKHSGHGHFHVVLLVVAVDLPQVPGRGIERRQILRFHLHAMIRKIVDPALSVLGNSRENDIGTAIHFMVSHDRNLVEIDVLAGPDVFLDRRLLLIDDHRREPMLFHFQAGLCHLRPCRFLGQTQRDLGFALRNLAVHRQFDITDPLVEVQRLVEDDDGEFLLRAEVLDDRGNVIVGRIDFLGDVNDFVRDFPKAIVDKTPQTLRHVLHEFLQISIRHSPRRRE